MKTTKIDGGQVLVTGGSGIVGHYVIYALKEKFDIVVADRKKPFANVKYVKIYLSKEFTISNDFEICIDLAASVGGIRYFTQRPVENLRDNTRITSNTLDAVTNCNIRQFIYTSSSGVYERAVRFPVEEDDLVSLPVPLSTYNLSKLIGEKLCKAYNEQFGIPYTILRLFNVYGPYELPNPDYSHVIPDLIKKVLLKQNPVEIYGTGEQTRTFTHGIDVGRAYSLSINNSNAMNQIFNVAGNKEITIRTLLTNIWNMVYPNGEILRIKLLPMLPNDVLRRVASTSKIFDKIRWKSEIALMDGLYETIEFIRKHQQ